MKVVKKGTRTIPWYVGLQYTCNKCGTVVEFDHNDKHKVCNDESRFGNGGQYILFACPGCYNDNRVSTGPNDLFWVGREAAEKLERERGRYDGR